MEPGDLTALFSPCDPSAATISSVSDNGGDNSEHSGNRRRLCGGGCERPINVCLCDAIPPEPISTSTQVVILHHPHEQRHKLATVPVLSKCLRDCQTIVGRRLRLGVSPLLDGLYNEAVQNPNQTSRAIYLFPGTDTSPAVDISTWRNSLDGLSTRNNVLIAFDGTWKHAKEMVHASLPFLSKFAIRACLDYDAGKDGGSIYDSDLILRKEPFRGCMSTLEAIARALRVLEPCGVEVEERLVEVLRTMVRLQACYLKPMKVRPKLAKKVKEVEQKSRRELEL